MSLSVNANISFSVISELSLETSRFINSSNSLGQSNCKSSDDFSSSTESMSVAIGTSISEQISFNSSPETCSIVSLVALLFLLLNSNETPLVVVNMNGVNSGRSSLFVNFSESVSKSWFWSALINPNGTSKVRMFESESTSTLKRDVSLLLLKAITTPFT